MVNLRKSMLGALAALLVTLVLAAGGVQIASAQDSSGNITINEGNSSVNAQDADQENEGGSNNTQSQDQGNSDEADSNNDTEQGNKVVLVEDIGSDETETGVVLVEDIGGDETETDVEGDNNNVAAGDGGIIAALIALLLSILAP